MADMVYWIERDSIAISSKSGDSFSGPAGDKTVNMFIIKKADPFVSSDEGGEDETGLNESPNIPSEFHEAIAYNAISKGYEFKPETLQLAPYWDTKFQRAIAEGKRYANTNKDGSSLAIKGAEY